MKSTLLLCSILAGLLTTSVTHATLELTSVTPDDGVDGDQFGFSVDVDGDLMAVGASFADIDGVEKQGAVYLFERNDTGVWLQIKKITAGDGVAFDQLGFSVGVSGNVVVAGAEEAPISGNSSQGAAYVFARDFGGADNWGQVRKLEAATSIGNNAEYGHSIDIDGDTVIVGAPKAGLPGNAYIYQRDEGGVDNWGELIVLQDDISDSNAGFGTSVAIDGDTVVVGAELLDMNQGSFNNEGGGYVFARNEGGSDNWGQTDKLFASDAGGNDRFGRGVAIEGSTIVIGANAWDGVASSEGQAYVYTNMVRGSGSWTEVAMLDATDGVGFDLFGRAVAVLGTTAIAASSVHDDGRGKAYRYDADEGGAGNWGESDQLTASDAAADDFLGASVAMTSGFIIVGAYGNGAGEVYVYEGPTVITTPDTDGDGVLDDIDNCTVVANPTQRDSNGDGHGNVCDFDYTNNCVTNFLDLGPFSDAFGAITGDANFNDDVDLDANGVINFLDFGVPPNNFAAFFTEPPGPSASACVPVP